MKVKSRFQYLLPGGWTAEVWCGAMRACNAAREFVPLHKMTDEQRSEIARLFDNRYDRPTQEEMDSIMPVGLEL